MIPGGTPIRREEVSLDANVDVRLTQAGKAVLARFYEEGGGKRCHEHRQLTACRRETRGVHFSARATDENLR